MECDDLIIITRRRKTQYILYHTYYSKSIENFIKQSYVSFSFWNNYIIYYNLTKVKHFILTIFNNQILLCHFYILFDK